MDKLKQRSDCFSLVLNDSGADLFKNTHYVYNRCVTDSDICVVYVAVIKHDNDKDEYGNVKTVHYHVVIQFDKICRVSSVINWFVKRFSCNINQVSCEKCSSLIMATRYLIHLDELGDEKYHYDSLDIESNDINFVNKAMKYQKNINSIDDLIVLVRQYKNLLELMSVIGYENYKRYRVIISDIRRELKYIV